MSMVTDHPLQSSWKQIPAPLDVSGNGGPLRQRLKYCTLTGVDEGVPLDALVEMARRHPYVEFAVLYSEKLQGRGRYPALSYITALAREIAVLPDLNLALHVCGSAVGELLKDSGHVSSVGSAFDRIQLNMVAGRHDLHFVCDLLDRLKAKTVITQFNTSNRGLWRSLSHKANHAVLFDESGGKGIEPEAWTSPLEILSEALPFEAFDPMCGYAGGLGPDNIATHLRLIDKVAGRKKFWIDMESSLRNSKDRFDLGLAQRCLDAVETVLTEKGGAHAI